MKKLLLASLALLVFVTAGYAECFVGFYQQTITYSDKAQNAVRCYAQRQSDGPYNCAGRKCTKASDAGKFYTASILASGSARVVTQTGSAVMTATGSVGNMPTVDYDGATGSCKVEYGPDYDGPLDFYHAAPWALNSCGVRR